MASATRRVPQYYANGHWMDAADVTVPASDISVLRGFGVFDVTLTYNHKPFRLDDHLDRLWNSASRSGITIPESRETITALVYEGIKRNGVPGQELTVKVIVTGGTSPDAISPSPTSSLLLAFPPAPSYSSWQYSDGIKLITVEHSRFEPTIKCLNYFAAVLSLQRAREQGALDVLYLQEGTRNILEGTTVNFFGVIDGKLYTAQDGVLFGVTRKAVLLLAERLKIPVVLGPLPASRIPEFQEAFITSSTREVMPVIQIDSQVIGSGKVGSISHALGAAFKQYAVEEGAK